jgi:putative ubiquitin-RnfH superfamily antitoxin RatB of RatAB toxin-antitoxin module
MIRVAVVHAVSGTQRVIGVELQEGASVRDAIASSGLLAEFPEIDLARATVGIFGERTTLDTRVEEGDRVEIYRPLKADPKTARRARAAQRRPRQGN